MPRVARHAVQLDAVDRVALPAGERRVVLHEVRVKLVGGPNGRLDQVALSRRVEVRGGHFEKARRVVCRFIRNPRTSLLSWDDL